MRHNDGWTFHQVVRFWMPDFTQKVDKHHEMARSGPMNLVTMFASNGSGRVGIGFSAAAAMLREDETGEEGRSPPRIRFRESPGHTKEKRGPP